VGDLVGCGRSHADEEDPRIVMVRKIGGDRQCLVQSVDMSEVDREKNVLKHGRSNRLNRFKYPTKGMKALEASDGRAPRSSETRKLAEFRVPATSDQCKAESASAKPGFDLDNPCWRPNTISPARS
jgi:hypothetical protein